MFARNGQRVLQVMLLSGSRLPPPQHDDDGTTTHGEDASSPRPPPPQRDDAMRPSPEASPSMTVAPPTSPHSPPPTSPPPTSPPPASPELPVRTVSKRRGIFRRLHEPILEMSELATSYARKGSLTPD